MMQDKGIILFDGVCNLCNAFVQKVIKADKKDYFRFASLQSEIAQELLAPYPGVQDLKTVVLIEDGRLYTKSTAALRISKQLSGIWPVLQSGFIFPRFFRDGIYNFVAKNRHRWFGKKDQCMVPSSGLKNKFLSIDIVSK